MPRKVASPLAVERLEDRVNPAGNLLVTTYVDPYDPWAQQVLREFTPTGTLVQSVNIVTGDEARDLSVDSNGNVHVYYGTFDPLLYTRDAATGDWSTRTHSGWSTANNLTYGGLAHFNGYVFATDMRTSYDEDLLMGIVRFNLSDNTSVRFADNLDPIDLNMGLDGYLYALDGGNGVHVYDPLTMNHVRFVSFIGDPQASPDWRSIAVDTQGRIFIATWNGEVCRFSPNGVHEQTLRMSDHGYAREGLWDLDVAGDGELIFTGGLYVFRSTTELTGITNAFTMQGGAGFVTFAEPQQASSRIASFEVSAPPDAVAGQPVSVTVTAKDAGGSTKTDYTGTIRFTSSDGQAILPGNYTFAAADNGVKSFTVTFKTSGEETITAADVAHASALGSDVVTVTASGAGSFDVETPSEAVAGEPFDLTVTARDAFGNIATAYDGTLHFSSTDPAADLPGDATLTNGVGSFPVTLMTEGVWTITAEDPIANISAESNPITVTIPLSAPPIIADFGNRGLRRWTEADGWTTISPLNAERVVQSADGSTVVADFGHRGLRRWTETQGWTTLSSANVDKAVVAADGSTVVADFGSGGLRHWTAADGWTRLARGNAQNVFISSDGLAVVAEFGWGGIRRWTESGGWFMATNANPIRIAADAACETVIADFGSIGLWRWTASTDEWLQLSPQNVLRVVISGDGQTVVADFNGRGLQRWTETDGWLQLSPLNAERVTISPDGQDVVADFGSRGLQSWSAEDGWTILSAANVQDVLLSPTSASVLADFGTGGLRLYTTAWTTLAGLDPEQILIV